jgi:hypothetical protein
MPERCWKCGRHIAEEGERIDEEGYLIDEEGNDLDPDGALLWTPGPVVVIVIDEDEVGCGIGRREPGKAQRRGDETVCAYCWTTIKALGF